MKYIGINDVRTGNMAYYIYNEGFAHKTSDDVVCLFLYHYLNNFVEDGTDELHLSCDNWVRQNKNHVVIKMLMVLIKIQKFKVINFFFPLCGHLLLPCDHDFWLWRGNAASITDCTPLKICGRCNF